MKINDNLYVQTGDGYIKFKDGTLICYGEIIVGKIAKATKFTFTQNLPMSYIDTNFSIATSIKGGSNFYTSVGWCEKNLTTSSFTLEAWNDNKNSNATFTSFLYITIGRWK